jgi:hypothetical protein
LNVNAIALNSSTLQERPNGANFWKDSPYESFYTMSSPVAKGSRGERLAAEIMETLDHDILRKKNGKLARLAGNSRDHDIVVDGHRVEVKLSLTWGKEVDQFTWQQIRSLQEYDRIIFVGINPNEAKMWWATKKDLEDNLFGRHIFRQHGGKEGKQELYWIRNNIPAWFRTIEEWK